MREVNKCKIVMSKCYTLFDFVILIFSMITTQLNLSIHISWNSKSLLYDSSVSVQAKMELFHVEFIFIFIRNLSFISIIHNKK